MLLPHNNEVTKPCALNTFLDELAELRIDEGLIKNKKLRSDLIEKKKASEMPKILPITRVIMRRVHRVERKRGRREEDEEEVASENGVEAEDTQESDSDTENDSQKTESSSLETSTTFHSENAYEHCENSNVYGTLIMKCQECSWHDYFKIFPMCDLEIPEERNCIKEGFLRCHDCGAITHKNAKTLETEF